RLVLRWPTGLKDEHHGPGLRSAPCPWNGLGFQSQQVGQASAEQAQCSCLDQLAPANARVVRRVATLVTHGMSPGRIAIEAPFWSAAVIGRFFLLSLFSAQRKKTKAANHRRTPKGGFTISGSEQLRERPAFLQQVEGTPFAVGGVQVI